MNVKTARKVPPMLLVISIALLVPNRGDSGWKRFIRSEPVQDQPVVADAVTGLVWQGCAAGQSGIDCSGSVTTSNWNAAVSYCDSLDWGGSTDWRLPDVKELYSILDARRVSTSIDPTAFPQTPASCFWSSSSYVGSSSSAWYVSFYNGYGFVYSVNVGGKAFDNHVRCVRSGP
ncbi:MAG: DUF1566 domain-containing protein [Deltaproteobacteria bacterium]|nr:DUF1566 domain-containing protein [Deltaproteobacteria bacterium]